VTGIGFLECLTHGNNRLVHDSLAAELDMMLNQTQMKGMAVQDEHNKWLTERTVTEKAKTTYKEEDGLEGCTIVHLTRNATLASTRVCSALLRPH